MPTLAERYLLHEQLGYNGVSTVFRATDIDGRHIVALRQFEPWVAEDPEFTAHFRRDALQAQALDHPHIVATLDWGDGPGHYYTVHKHIWGGSLDTRFDAPAEERLSLLGAMVQAASALAYLHECGLLQRSLKPSDILLHTDGRALLGYVGAVPRYAPAGATAPEMALRDIAYRAPEDLLGRPLSPASDVYAFGVVLYQLCTGRLPFEAATPLALATAQLRERPMPPRWYVPALSTACEEVVLCCLEKDPERRYASGAALLQALSASLAMPSLSTAARVRVRRVAPSLRLLRAPDARSGAESAAANGNNLSSLVVTAPPAAGPYQALPHMLHEDFGDSAPGSILDLLRHEDPAWQAAQDNQAEEHASWRRRRRTLHAAIALNIFFLLIWLSWLFDFTHAANPLLYGLLVLAQMFSTAQVLGYWYTVWREPAPSHSLARLAGRVDVFIPTYNEPLELVEETVRAAVAMRYPHRTFVLDDGNRPEIGEMAARAGAEWITRGGNRGAKAGNLNNALSITDGDYFAVFDADHVPQPHFLERMLPYMADPKLAFVQAPQHYVNAGHSFIAESATDQQAIFFGPICAGKGALGAVFCCGTNVLLRRSAIAREGGFPEDSVTEDLAVSVRLHERGWTSRYVVDNLAAGLAPEDLGAYFSQQRRWARGGIEVLLRGLLRRSRLPLHLRLQYAWSLMYYLMSLSTLVYIMLPILALLFNQQTVTEAGSRDTLLYFMPYIALTFFIFARSMDGKKTFRAMQLDYGLFPVFLGALVSVLRREKARFVVTRKVRSSERFFHLVKPQAATLALCLFAIAVGLARYDGARTANNIAWAAFNIVMLSGVLIAAAPRRLEQRVEVTVETPDAEALQATA